MTGSVAKRYAKKDEEVDGGEKLEMPGFQTERRAA